MVDVLPAYWVFNAIAISMMSLMIFMNFFILYKYTLEMKTWKKLEYQLILLRVTCDAFNGIFGLVYITISVINTFDHYVPYEVTFLFGLVAFTLMEIRCFIAATIAVERVLATTFPLKFYHYRNRISNFAILGFIFSTGIASDVVLFGFCQYRFETVSGCTNFNCATPICFQRYSSATRMIYSSTNAVFSIILCYNLFHLSMKKSKVSIDIRKANWMSLTDGLSSLSLELIPWIIFYYGIIDSKPLGPIIGAFRTTGRVIEAFVMLKLMKKGVVIQPSRISVTTRQL